MDKLKDEFELERGYQFGELELEKSVHLMNLNLKKNIHLVNLNWKKGSFNELELEITELCCAKQGVFQNCVVPLRLWL